MIGHAHSHLDIPFNLIVGTFYLCSTINLPPIFCNNGLRCVAVLWLLC
jgi:hypothetical protein